MEKINTQAASDLFATVLRLETVAECAAFFEDICTIKEIQDISQRLLDTEESNIKQMQGYL